MQPTKSMYEYMSEMNRLFPRTAENDFFSTPIQPNSMHSPLRQSSINRSSSSADSASSESFPDLSHRLDSFRSDQSFDTPFATKRQRPITGRRIFDNQERPSPMLEPIPKPFREEMNIWQPEDQYFFPHTPPSVTDEHKKYTQTQFYELFPAEQKSFEFRTPISQRSPSNSASIGNSPLFSPTSSNFSPKESNFSPISSKFGLPRMPAQPLFHNTPNFASSSRYDEKPTKMCTFCRKNGETPLVYMTHFVKEKIGGQNVVTCPILRSHVCSTCGASGDNAHTITYCPVLRSTNNGQPLQSTTITLKNTRIKSNGRRRY